MRVLLDTHALFWALGGNRNLSGRAASAISDPDTDVLISAVSAYEICFKHRLGKLPEAAALVTDFQGKVASLAADWLPISPAHAIAAARLEPSHRDPFDRLLIAQSILEDVPLVSNEALFDQFGVQRLW